MTTNISEKGEIDVVRSTRQIIYEELPQWEWIQWAITLITGCPYEGQRAMFNKKSGYAFSLALAMLIGGYLICSFTLSLSWYGLCLLPVGWILVTGSARALQTGLMHHCIHAQFTGRRATDMIVGDTISILLCIANVNDYFLSHCSVHHSPGAVASIDDDDLKFLLLLGFKPGMTKQKLWTHFWKVMFSFRFHYLFLKARFRSNFVKAKPQRIVAATVWWFVVALILYFTEAWVVFGVAFLFPITLIYHCSALAQFISEHKWYYDTDDFGRLSHLSKKEQMVRSKLLSPTRFFGETPPKKGADIGDWVIWWLRMLFLHAPLRMAVIPTPCLVWHPTHHSKASSDWRNVDFQGLEWAKAKPDEYIPVWGLGNAIDLVFEIMSQKTALKVDISDINTEEAMLGM